MNDMDGCWPVLPQNQPLTLTKPATGRGMALPAPMSVLFNGDQLEVSAVLANAESVDLLIRALEANKPLLPEKPKEEAAN